MTVDSAERGAATATPTSLTFAHATWDTVKTVGLERLNVPTVTPTSIVPLNPSANVRRRGLA